MIYIIEDRRIPLHFIFNIICFSTVNKGVVHDMHVNYVFISKPDIAADFNSIVMCCIYTCSVLDNEVLNRNLGCKGMYVLYPDATNDFRSGLSN